MKIKQLDDKYWVTWQSHVDTIKEAERWCWETFGSGWGFMAIDEPNNIGKAVVVLQFHRLAHANWFILKYGSL